MTTKHRPRPGLRVRLLADRTDGERVKRYDPETGAGYLADPATWDRNDPATWEEKPWPVAGLAIEGDAPQSCTVPTTFVRKRAAEGLLTIEGERVVHRPGGPPEDQWRVTHTLVHADALVLHTVDGDVRYRVVRQPDKYVAGGADEDPVTPELYAAGETDVAWFYICELED